MENIEAMVSVDGVDGVSSGPLALSISLGIFKLFAHPAYVSAYEKAREACHRSKTARGMAWYSLGHAKHWAPRLTPILLVGGDDHYMSKAARRWSETLRPKGDQVL